MANKTSKKKKKVFKKKKAAKKSAPKGKAAGKPAGKSTTGAPGPYRGDQSGCPKCSARPGDGIIEIEVNSVRHWMAYVDFENPNHPDLDNRKIKKLNRKDFEPYFAPLEFIGWHRLTPHWEHVLSPAKKDVSNTFVFYGANISSDYWALEDLKKYLGAQKKHSGGSARVKELAKG